MKKPPFQPAQAHGRHLFAANEPRPPVAPDPQLCRRYFGNLTEADLTLDDVARKNEKRAMDLQLRQQDVDDLIARR